MAELLTRQIVYEYQKRLQALNVLNGHHVPDIITICERKRWEDEFNDKYGN